MECTFDNCAAISELRISKASEQRCASGKFTSCGRCEGCDIGSQLTYTKQWFPRCAEQTKRQFVLGLVHRFRSTDLHDSINNLLNTLEGKDFTYARSRNRPSLKEDVSTSSSNHALDKWQLNKDIYKCLNWFESSRYWTKYNFMLGLMQVCNAQLLRIIGSESLSVSLLNSEREFYDTDGGEEADEGDTEFSTVCEDSMMLTKVGAGTVSEQDGDQCDDGSSQRVTFDSVYNSSQSLLHSQDNNHLMRGKDRKYPVQHLPRSATRGKISQDIKSMVSTPFSETEQVNSKNPTTSSGQTNSSPVSGSKLKCALNGKMLTAEDLRTCVIDDDLSDAIDDDYISVEPSSVSDFPLLSTCLLVQRHKDFIRCLPVHISKFVLNYLDKASLTNCLCISKHWRILAEEVQKDAFVHQTMIEEVMVMQGATAKGLNPKYAKKLLVCIPKYEEEVRVEEANSVNEQSSLEDMTRHNLRSRNSRGLQVRSMAYCYEGIETIQVEMEERNLFCGAYNVFVLQDTQDSNRCATFSGGRLVACGSSDRRVRLLDAITGRSEKNIKGHAGSVKCMIISEKRGVVLSGSYDTSVRCWDIRQGNCKCIFRGHKATVLCLALSGHNLASGSRDKSVKVWNIETGKCRRTFRHHHVVLSIDVSDSVVISGCEGCKIKVWEIESATLVKTLEGHQSPISGVTFNEYHIISSSTDCYALAWSAIGEHKKCLQAFRHPKEVLCVKLMYCRVITGAADGKIRIWNILNGDCLRVIRGNSKNDVITSLYIADNRIVVNTLSNLLILNFEPITLNYNLPPDRPQSLGKLNNYSKCPPRRRPRSYVRAQKQARGAYPENLLSGPALSCPAFSGYFDRSVSMTPLTMQPTSSSRISSAPANVTGHGVNVTGHGVTRQISRSIDEHVQRLSHARERPHSSPAHVRQRKGHLEPASPDKSTPLSTNNQPNVLVKNIVPRPRPDPLPTKHSLHVLIRGRSAPAVRTAVLPYNERGWTTSVRDEAMAPHNKLMPTATQVREFVRRRPKSAQVVTGRKETSGDSPLKSESCLRLKTYSAEVHEKQVSLEMKEKEVEKCRGKMRTPHKQKIQRPLSCKTY